MHWSEQFCDFRWVFGVFLVVIGVVQDGPSQEIVFLPDFKSESFRHLAVHNSGAVLLSGEDSESDAVVWTYQTNSLSVEYLHPPPGSDGTPWLLAISRDGLYGAGLVFEDDTPSRSVVWHLGTSAAPTLIPPPVEGVAMRPTTIASASHGPVVAGYTGHESFIWTADRGTRFWGDRLPASRIRTILGMTGDGQIFAGSEGSVMDSSTGTSSAVVGPEWAPTLFRPFFGALAISPNGRNLSVVVATAPEFSTSIWLEQLGLISAPPQCLINRVTDSGLAAGINHDLDTAILFDPRGRKSFFQFDDWWSREYPEHPLPGSVRRVIDLYETNNRLYCLAVITDPTTEFSGDYLIIVPRKQPRGLQTGLSPTWEDGSETRDR